jgi:predicted HTH transcriptional regulator
VVALARLFGFKRTGAKIRQAIEEVVRSLIDEGLVSHRRDGTLQTGEAELPDETPAASEGDLAALIQQGESSHLEFKSTLRTDLSRGSVMKELEKVVAKTIAGFLNGGGGTLLIGVADDGSTVGLEPDYRTLGQKGDRDGFELHLMQVLGRAVGTAALAFVRVNIHKLEEKDVCRVDVRRSPEPIFVTEGQNPVFYVRLGNATHPMSVADAHQYIRNHWH